MGPGSSPTQWFKALISMPNTRAHITAVTLKPFNSASFGLESAHVQGVDDKASQPQRP